MIAYINLVFLNIDSGEHFTNLPHEKQTFGGRGKAIYPDTLGGLEHPD